MPRPYIPHGVIPAVLLPFDNDLAIDEAAFRKHLRDVAATEGISAVTINAHSTEVASCTFEEQRKVLDIARDEIGARLPLVNGIWADGSLEAARIARMATAGAYVTVIGVFIRDKIAGRPLTIHGDGTQTRSFCFVTDLVRGLIALAESTYHEPVNIGNPDEYTLLALADAVLAVTGSDSPIVFADQMYSPAIRASSSMMIASCQNVPPPPPCSSGTLAHSNPSAPALRHRSRSM